MSREDYAETADWRKKTYAKWSVDHLQMAIKKGKEGHDTEAKMYMALANLYHKYAGGYEEGSSKPKLTLIDGDKS